jgi:hypothetical protein
MAAGWKVASEAIEEVSYIFSFLFLAFYWKILVRRKGSPLGPILAPDGGPAMLPPFEEVMVTLGGLMLGINSGVS